MLMPKLDKNMSIKDWIIYLAGLFILFLIITSLLVVIFPKNDVTNDNILKGLEKIQHTPKFSIQSIQDDEFNDWLPENLTQDFLQDIAEIIYKGDGTGILEILFSLIPIIGSDPAADSLLIPIFILGFTGIYWKLKKMGYLN